MSVVKFSMCECDIFRRTLRKYWIREWKTNAVCKSKHKTIYPNLNPEHRFLL